MGLRDAPADTGHGAADGVERRAEAVDALVREAFGRAQPDVTLAAVGGYGRRELFPYSDVDLLLLTARNVPAAGRERIAGFLSILWDAGLRISQSVHTAEECCQMHEGNLELTVSLLDRRFLHGDPARFEELDREFPRFLNSERAGIVSRLCQLTRERHAKHGDTIYHLEPNVKEHPGALRDLHVLRWLQQLKPFGLEPLEEARDFLFAVRAKLHERSRRDDNLLSFEAQDALSDDPARWMREYYRNARQIYRSTVRAMELCEGSEKAILAQFRDWRSRVSNAEFTVSRERVLLRNPAQFETEPSAAQRLMLFAARHQFRLAPDTERRLAAAPKAQWTWTELRELLRLPRCANALRIMAESGVLEAIIPEWRRIDCLVVRDFYHRYTVDEHTLVTLQGLEDLASTADPARRRFAGLLSETGNLELLRLALLLHDTGKGEGGGRHDERSTELARGVLERLGLPQDEGQTILFLVQHHLALSSVMTSRDLSDASTARQLAERVETIERLKLLTLMTYADIGAVNPEALSPWRLEQLWRVYLIGQDELTRELATSRIQAPPQAAPGAEAFLEGFPTRYLKTHTPQRIAGHLELARLGTAVELSRAHGAWELTLIADDRPFLFASLSGVLASFGFNILKAEAFANKSGRVLDVFVFEDPLRTLELNPPEMERLRDTALRAAQGKVDVARLMKSRRRPAVFHRIAPVVSFNNEVSGSCTLVELVAEDRPGLLYDLTYTFSSQGANIEVVLIDTEAHKALDVFYVTSKGEKLSEDCIGALRLNLLEACKG